MSKAAPGVRPYVFVGVAGFLVFLMWVFPRDSLFPKTETPICSTAIPATAPVTTCVCEQGPAPTCDSVKDPASIEIVKTVYFEEEEQMVQDVLLYTPVLGTGCKDNCNQDKGWGKCNEELTQCACSLGRAGDDCGFSIKSLYPTTKIYEGLEARPLDLAGWNMGGRLYESLVKALKPNLVVEVGVFKGNTACAFGQALKDQGKGIYVGVDVWLPFETYWVDKSFIPEEGWGFVNGWPTVYYTFLNNVKHKGLEEAMAPFPAKSGIAGEFFRALGLKPDIVHIDGGHTYRDVIFDLELWWEVLRPGGVILGDDWMDMWAEVMQAGSEFARKHGVQVKQYQNKFWVQKPLSA